MTLSAETEDATNVPVAGLQGVNIGVTAEHTELFTADSILREDVRKAQAGVPVEFETAKWDATFVKQWLGGGTGESFSIEDTSEVTLFNITGSVFNDEGDEFEAEATDVYFEELDVFDASMGEFISKSQSGTGKDVNITETENV